jgi:hypothetical protein
VDLLAFGSDVEPFVLLELLWSGVRWMVLGEGE